ncbi:MFS transporter [Photobacterium sp. CCB-ST2H9]|uniref:MFS transporter n=1 Tax=Photobacterium sp. CCB-ST2H9 TaxID=2912855 RepID=UPI002003E0F1|nr:MFS transporter [Photobacterium sp. CCB-ST2H9]UTM59629.1 MFS transporter [Photobacterium sp. CCB-ST2H9]
MNTKYNYYLILFVVSAIAVVSQLYLLLPVSQLLADVFHSRTESIVLLTSCFGFAYASGFLFWGPLSDRFGRKAVLVAGMAGLSVTTIIVALSQQYEWVLTLRIIQGFMAASFPPVALAFIGESFPEKMRMKGIAWLSSAFLLSALVGQTLGAAMIEDSLQNVMLLLSSVYILSLLACSRLPGSQSQNTPKVNAKGYFNILFGTVTNLRLLRIYLVALVLLGSFVTLYATLTSQHAGGFIFENLQVNDLRLYSIPCMFMPLLIGRFIVRLGALTTVFISVITASLTLFLQMQTSDSVVFIILHLIFVSSIASAVPSVISLVSQTSDASNRGLAVSLYTFTLFIGASIGAVIPMHFGEKGVLYFSACLVLSALLNVPLSIFRKEKSRYAS